MKLAALSVDLDEIPCYHAVHGLGHATEGAHAVYETAVPRLRALFARLGVPCTFFAIGSDLAHAPSSVALRGLHDAGHEIANHTLSHRYDLTRMNRDAIAREIAGGADAIEQSVGTRPVGFRAPGYTITDTVFDVLDAQGYAYDSSVFPCPAYQLPKAALIAWIALRGRTSRSIVDHPAVLAAPADPYTPARPYWRRSARAGLALRELPIGVTRGARLPVIGTSLLLAGPRGAVALAAMTSGRPLVNLELHGLDVLGGQEDGLTALARHQHDLNVAVERKLETLRALVEHLARTGHAFVTLREAAERTRS